MGTGHVLRLRRRTLVSVKAPMRRDAPVVTVDLHRRIGESGFEHLPDKLIGHTVVVVLDLDVVIDVDPTILPVADLIAPARQGQQHRTIEALKQHAATCPEMLHGPIIELIELGANRAIELPEAEKDHIAQPRQNPTLGHQYRIFDFRLITGFSGDAPGSRQPHSAWPGPENCG